MKTPDMQTPQKTLRVWDPFVRLFHWLLVLGIAAAWLTSSVRDDTHQWIGIGIGVLLVARIVWGFIGPHYARFSQFIRSPLATFEYLVSILTGSAQRYIGHNPAGAAMVVFLLLAVSATVATGWLITTDAYYGDDMMQTLHSLCAYSVIGPAIFHVFGVFSASRHHHENLIKAMVTGKKRVAAPEDVDD
jgi:cytochrome b